MDTLEQFYGKVSNIAEQFYGEDVPKLVEVSKNDQKSHGNPTTPQPHVPITQEAQQTFIGDGIDSTATVNANGTHTIDSIQQHCGFSCEDSIIVNYAAVHNGFGMEDSIIVDHVLQKKNQPARSFQAKAYNAYKTILTDVGAKTEVPQTVTAAVPQAAKTPAPITSEHVSRLAAEYDFQVANHAKMRTENPAELTVCKIKCLTAKVEHLVANRLCASHETSQDKLVVKLKSQGLIDLLRATITQMEKNNAELMQRNTAYDELVQERDSLVKERDFLSHSLIRPVTERDELVMERDEVVEDHKDLQDNICFKESLCLDLNTTGISDTEGNSTKAQTDEPTNTFWTQLAKKWTNEINDSPTVRVRIDSDLFLRFLYDGLRCYDTTHDEFEALWERSRTTTKELESVILERDALAGNNVVVVPKQEPELECVKADTLTLAKSTASTTSTGTGLFMVGALGLGALVGLIGGQMLKAKADSDGEENQDQITDPLIV